MESVHEALRKMLTDLGYSVASDTCATSEGLYVRDEGDLAGALFAIHDSAQAAFDEMYQGSWTEGLPPRFAVLPRSAADEQSFELLEQVRIVPLLFVMRDDSIEFCDVDVVKRHMPG